MHLKSAYPEPLQILKLNKLLKNLDTLHASLFLVLAAGPALKLLMPVFAFQDKSFSEAKSPLDK